MSRGLRVISLLLFVTAAAGVAGLWTRGAEQMTEPAGEVSPDDAGGLDTLARAPDGVRVRVQVLNGSGRPGLARRATQQLRDYGFDVVDYGSRGDTTQVTEVRVTASTRAWGDRVALALARAQVREQEGGLGYVDVVVLLGHDWQPAPQPLRP
jgi:hypothetical protein